MLHFYTPLIDHQIVDGGKCGQRSIILAMIRGWVFYFLLLCCERYEHVPTGSLYHENMKEKKGKNIECLKFPVHEKKRKNFVHFFGKKGPLFIFWLRC